jgi:hypothetical protein
VLPVHVKSQHEINYPTPVRDMSRTGLVACRSLGLPCHAVSENQAGHQPQLVKLADERYAVRCQQCELRSDEDVPIGIGVPISSRAEAEAILRNHADWAA